MKGEESTTTRAKVRFYGDDIGFQFSRTGNGSRSRTTKVINIRDAVSDDIDKIWKKASGRRGKGNRTKRRGLPSGWNEEIDIKDHEVVRDYTPREDSPFKTYVGDASFRFEEESARWVKVWGTGYKGALPTKWESLEYVGWGESLEEALAPDPEDKKDCTDCPHYVHEKVCEVERDLCPFNFMEER